MSMSGVTRTCTLGAILDALDLAGGSVARVFRMADVSPRLLDDPSRVIFLKDQFALLDATAREIGDAAVAARLSIDAGVSGLGAYGYWIASQPTLRDALDVARTMMPHALQTATRTGFTTAGRWSTWTYEVDDAVVVGRRQNDLLCIGYVLDIFRRFGGGDWMPQRLTVAGPAIDARASIETMYGCRLEIGQGLSVTFPTEMLECVNLAPLAPRPYRPLAPGADPPTLVTHAIESGLGGRRPDLPRTARRLGMTPRTLQRRLHEHGTSFERLLDGTLADHALSRLASGATPITAIAYELGFSDPAHFSRAFKRWTGLTPIEVRRSGSRVGPVA